MSVARVWTLVIKELLSLLRDPKSRAVLIGPPLIQLVLFSFAATLEVKNVSIAVYNRDYGLHGHELVQRLRGSPTFTDVRRVHDLPALQRMLDEQQVLLGIHLPPDFSRRIERGDTGTVQLLLDGRRSNAAQIVNGYVAQLVQDYESSWRERQQLPSMPATVIERNWFNPNGLYLWFTVPSLVAILAMMIAIVVTALSVARERELGTFDQLLVSPLTPSEILIGKTVPAVIIGVFEGVVIWAVAVYLFGIPFAGSPVLMLFTLWVFVSSVVGVGLFISALSKTQQQAILGAFVFLVPAVTLSGYASPVENMPEWLQTATWINPLRHAMVSVKGLFLKDMPFDQLWDNTWPLLIIGAVTLVAAGQLFRRRLE